MIARVLVRNHPRQDSIARVLVGVGQWDKTVTKSKWNQSTSGTYFDESHYWCYYSTTTRKNNHK